MSRFYLNQLLIYGLLLIGFGIYLIPTLLTSKSQLIEIKGVLRFVDTYVTTVTERTRGTKSQKAELVFYLSDRQQKFRLVENIGNKYRNEEFENIKKELKRADTIKVWVKKSEFETYEPIIFQIDTDLKTILEFEDVRTKESGMILFLLLLGLGSLTFYFWKMYPEKFKKLFGNTCRRKFVNVPL